MLVRNPWAPASRTWFSITSLDAPCRRRPSARRAASRPPWRRRRAGRRHGSRGPAPGARSSAVTLRGQLGHLGRQVLADALGDAHGQYKPTDRGPCHDLTACPSNPRRHPGRSRRPTPATVTSWPSAPTSRPGTLLAAYRRGLFPMAVEVPVAARPRRWPGGRRSSGVCCRSPGCGSAGRCASPRAASRSGWTPPSPRSSPAVRTRDAPAGGSTSDHRGVHRAAPARLGALGRGLARRRARRGPVRRRHRRPVRRVSRCSPARATPRRSR